MNKIWMDENGLIIPAGRVTSNEKLCERQATKIVKAATALNRKIAELKGFVETASDDIYQKMMDELKIDTTKRKGNFTWYNFDKSIKIEIDINENAKFDDILIAACQEKLMKFLDENITTELTFVKQLILDAFKTRNGKLDTKRVFGLLKYRQKIKNKLFNEAMDILEKSYRRVFSKRYTRIWIKDSKGEYNSIDLNYSSIEPIIKT